LRAIDVDDVECDRDASCPARLCDQLVGYEVRRYLVKDVGDLQQQPLPPEIARGLECDAGDQAGSRPNRGVLLALLHGFCEGRAVWEVTVERRAADPGGGGDLHHADTAIPGQFRGGDQDRFAAGKCVRTAGARVGVRLEAVR